MSEWFEQWFGEEYLRLYPHRDEQDAERAVALVDRLAPLAGCRVLDVGCGPGRHAERLAVRAACVVGFDLSLPLLARARQRMGARVSLVRGDMRHLPFAARSFDVVVNLFTSFGYFQDDDQHAAVLQDIAAALRPGGRFVLDYLNAPHVRATLTPHEERTVGEQRVGIERRITDDERYVVKEMHLMGDGRSFLERVRLFHPDDLAALLERAGLPVLTMAGDYEGSPLTGESPRAILLAGVPA